MGNRRGIIAGAVAAGVVGAAAIGGIVAGATVLARRAVEGERLTEDPLEVVNLGEAQGLPAVVLRGVGAGLRGDYTLLLAQDTIRARVGKVLGRESGNVVRELLAVDRGELRPGLRGRLTGWWYADPAELGLRVEEITYPTELGDAKAWVIRPKFPRKKRWAVHVHGRGAEPVETLRGVLPLARAGVTSLVISYRGDEGAPASANGRFGLGISESHDVDAAIAEVRRRGAERVTLVGWSMGGTACMLAMQRGAHRDVIDGILLDSPALDWPDVLRVHARAAGAPAPLADIGLELLRNNVVKSGVEDGLDAGSLVPERFARDLDVPVMIQASRGDGYVPSAGAERLAQLRPDLVELRLVDKAKHVRLWNMDRDGWEDAAFRFASTLPRPAFRG